MLLRLPADQMRALREALMAAGEKEIGGQLFGEQLAPSDFRATELTFQKRRGTIARFVVDLVQAARDSIRFFNKTRHQYTRYNYIGEWHSHPSFALRPSGVDLSTMQELVTAPDFVGHFAVLMIVRLDRGELTGRTWLFDPSGVMKDVTLEMES